MKFNRFKHLLKSSQTPIIYFFYDRLLNYLPQFQVYVGLSELWRRLRDAERAVACAARACDLGRGPRATDLNTRHHRTALLQMAAALRARGELGDAHDYCNVRKLPDSLFKAKKPGFRRFILGLFASVVAF